MQILWLSHLLPYPPKGGVQQRSFNLLKEISAHHTVSFLSFYQTAHQPTAAQIASAVQNLSTFCKVLGAFPIASDRSRLGRWVPALRSLIGDEPFTALWLQSEEFENAVRTTAAGWRPDLVHYDTISLAQYRPLFPDSLSCLTHHNVESDMLLRRAQNERSPAKRYYYAHEGESLRRYEKRVGSEFDLHVACSETDAERLKSILPGADIFVAPNGADLDYFRPAPPDTVTISASLVFAGGLAWYPNASAMRFFFDRVWAALLALAPQANITVIGRSPPEWLRELASRDARIKVTGFVDDVRPYLHAAEVYVCPIFDGGGTKLKMVDALATGKAIVAHPIACEGLDIEDGVHALMARTPEEFVAAICRLFGAVDLRRTLGVNARKLAESKYSFRAIGASLSEKYVALSAARREGSA